MTQTPPGEVFPGQTLPGQTLPGQTLPGQSSGESPGQTAPRPDQALAVAGAAGSGPADRPAHRPGVPALRARGNGTRPARRHRPGRFLGRVCRCRPRRRGPGSSGRRRRPGRPHRARFVGLGVARARERRRAGCRRGRDLDRAAASGARRGCDRTAGRARRRSGRLPAGGLLLRLPGEPVVVRGPLRARRTRTPGSPLSLVGVALVPVQLVEAVGALLLAIVALAVSLPPGAILVAALGARAALRTGLEPWRGDHAALGPLQLSTPQCWAAATAATLLVLSAVGVLPVGPLDLRRRWPRSCSPRSSGRSARPVAAGPMIGPWTRLDAGLDDRGVAGEQHPPDRTPAKWSAVPAGQGEPQPIAAQGLRERLPRAQPDAADEDPAEDVHDSRPAAAGCAGPATPGCAPGSGRTPRAGWVRQPGGAPRCRRRSARGSRRPRPARRARCPRGRTRRVRATRPRTRTRRSGSRPRPPRPTSPHCYGSDRRPTGAESSGVARAVPRRRPPAAGSGRASGPPRTSPQPRPARPRAGRLASSSRKNSSSPLTCGTPALRPAGMPRFSGRAIPRTPSGQAHRVPAVADHDDVELDVALRQQRPQPALELGRPPALGEDDDTETRRPGDRRPGQWRSAHRSRDELSTARRWPTTVTAAATTRPTSSHWVASPPNQRSSTAATQDQQGQLDRVEDPVEGDQPGRPSSGPQQAAGRRIDLLGVAHLGHPGVVPRHVHEIVLHLVQRDQQAEQQSEADPDAAEVRPADPDAQRDRDATLCDVVADPVEIDAPSRVRLLPARDLAVAAVQQHLQLAEHTTTTAASTPGQAVTRAAAAAARTISPVTPLALNPA